MPARPAFDPTTDLRAELHDLGPVVVHRPDATGALTPRTERQQAMSVFLDGAERIGYGLVIRGGDPLVAVRACPCCEHFECELVEGYAASVRRLGPYVLWLTAWGERHGFALDRYREVFGDGVDALAAPGERDVRDLDEPARAGAYRCPDGRTLAFDAERAPDTALARLAAWRGEPRPGLEAVAPPAAALELPSLAPGAPSLWLDARPRPDGRRAAYLPGVVVLPVWLAGPDVDAVATEALGGGPR